MRGKSGFLWVAVGILLLGACAPQNVRTTASTPTPSDSPTTSVPPSTTQPPTATPTPTPSESAKETPSASESPPPTVEMPPLQIVTDGAAKWVKPQFEMLPVAKAKEGKAGLDARHGGWSAADLTLAFEFNAAPIPSHHCAELSSAGFDTFDFAAVAEESERYANCLYDSWRPFAAQHGFKLLDHIDVVHCSVDTSERCKNFALDSPADAGDGTIRLAPATILERMEAWYTLMIAHETAHIVQQTLKVSPDTASVVGVGLEDLADGAGERGVRCMEGQAQCLAVAMLNAGHPRTEAQFLEMSAGNASDSGHWDAKAGRLWVRQGLLGRVGECNAYVAANSLLSWTKS